MRNSFKLCLAGLGAAALGLGFAGCTVTVSGDTVGAGGSAGWGGSASTSSGSGGLGGASGAAGSGGSTVDAGDAGDVVTADGDVDASADGGDEASDAAADTAPDAGCIADPTDAGTSSNPDLCVDLPYWNLSCTDDAGAYEPPGVSLCNQMHKYARRGAFQVFYDCLRDQARTTTPCAVTAVDYCTREKWPTGCPAGKVTLGDGTAWDCSNVVARCAGDGGAKAVALADCEKATDVFIDDGRRAIFECYAGKASTAATCSDDFYDCVSDLE